MASTLPAGDRVALVVGCDYAGTSLELPSPVKDAKALATALQKVGFASGDVQLLANPTRGQLVKAVDAFHEKLAATGGVGLFYFSGHGAQVDGTNYLIPAEATVKFREHLKEAGLSANYVATNMEAADNGVNILILDACRNNPLPSAKKKAFAKKGLAQMDGDGILFCFASKDGQEALDSGNGSVYTNALIKYLGTPKLSVFDMLTRVRKEVKDVTGGAQEPFLYSGLDQVFSFVPNGERVPDRSPVALVAPEVAKAEPIRPPATVPPVMPRVKPPGGKLGKLLDSGEIGKAVEFALPGGEKLVMRYCPGGKFTMGSPAGEEGRGDDEGQKDVELNSHYWMGETEVTQGQWESLMRKNPSEFKGMRLPVENVTWSDAYDFVKKLNESVIAPAGWEWDLPTEAQWERACRAGTKTAYSFGESGSDLAEHGNFADKNSGLIWADNRHDDGVGDRTAEVGSYRSNGYGLKDMHGNVWEWSGWGVVRGGSWRNDARYCRSAKRDEYNTTSDRAAFIGFRVALSSTEEK